VKELNPGVTDTPTPPSSPKFPVDSTGPTPLIVAIFKPFAGVEGGRVIPIMPVVSAAAVAMNASAYTTRLKGEVVCRVRTESFRVSSVVSPLGGGGEEEEGAFPPRAVNRGPFMRGTATAIPVHLHRICFLLLFVKMNMPTFF
jgi:hypothetical protein